MFDTGIPKIFEEADDNSKKFVAKSKVFGD